MIANGDTPFCVGIESGEATGWPMTDWIEDFVLRRSGPDVFEQWVNGEIPFDAPGAGRGGSGGVRPVVDGRSGVRRDAEHRSHPVRRGRPAVARRRLHDAPPGQLLRSELARARRPGCRRRREHVLPAGLGREPDDHPDRWDLRGCVQRPTRGAAADAVHRQRGVRGRTGRAPDRWLPLAEQEPGRGAVSDRRSSGALPRRSRPRAALVFDADDRIGGEGQRTWWNANVDIVRGDETVADAFAAVEEAFAGN